MAIKPVAVIAAAAIAGAIGFGGVTMASAQESSTTPTTAQDSTTAPSTESPTTNTPSTEAPSTTAPSTGNPAPAPGHSQDNPYCPNMGGSSGATGSGTNTTSDAANSV